MARKINIAQDKLDKYMGDIPIGIENAVDYNYLSIKWRKCPRDVRFILHELSTYDNGDDYILIRSAKGKGFFKTDRKQDIIEYRQECMSRAINTFAILKKINRVLKHSTNQLQLRNNLRTYRESNNLTQGCVCNMMSRFFTAFDKSLLSKMENGVCLPTYAQLSKLAEIYGCSSQELINIDLY